MRPDDRVTWWTKGASTKARTLKPTRLARTVSVGALPAMSPVVDCAKKSFSQEGVAGLVNAESVSLRAELCQ